ncbi:RNA-guided endonuclease InsQ/TnpB family protein [Actinomadura alba]|uniref:IS200/IS605 family element transposase accessory protein TnpB n=1 Tax=Actinomadura alba TaxID=406431 RepID=A0ABR7M0T4_9ACTN|nr:RNA-guided endonuclease TnpB family protein [Actinomadura alba]MBC6470610.1 IS200/IS605 family element transposase accessory protein TnpB [Actinomadura alba]
MALRKSAVKQAGCASVVQVRLLPTPADAERLATAVTICNTAATYASRIAWERRVFGQLALHRLIYRHLRDHFVGLGAQAAVRAIARVADAYTNRRATKKRAHIFRAHAAVPYDARMITFNRDARIASLWTPTGRVRAAYTGRDQDLKAIAELPIGECDLIERKGTWLLQIAVALPRPETADPFNGFLGVDQGTANLAVTCDGEVLPGKALPGTIENNGHIRALRDRRHRQRKRLQAKGTSSARRRLRVLSGRESRMMADINHQISKRVVREAERTGRGVAMEKLSGILGRVRAHRSQRRTLHGWAFAQQIAFTRYKAERVGIAFILVDAAYTSQTCPNSDCGHVSRRNRHARGMFRCQACGLAGHADHIAAINVAYRGADGWGAVNRPHATGLPSSRRAPESKPRASARGR